MPAMDYEQIASLYDLYANQDFDYDFFIQETRHIHGDVLELMSGTGRLSLPLVEAGVSLTCVDSSPAMLRKLEDKLRDRGLSARLVCADVTQLALGQTYDLIVIPFHSFAEVTDRAMQRQTLQRIREHVSSGGRFICTLHNPPVRLRQVDGQMYLRGAFPLPDNTGRLFLWSLERLDENAQMVRGHQFYELYDAGGALTTKLVLDIGFYLHYRDAFEALAVEAGFEVEALYGDYARAPFEESSSPVMIWVLRARED